MTDHNLRIGVLGLGSIGLRHAKNLLDMGYSVRAYDPTPQRRDMFEQAGGQVVKSKQDIATTCDAVVIASPSAFHLPDLEWAIENGKHAFVEKPLAHTLQGLDVICREAKDKNLTLSLGMNIRFNPAIRHLSEMIVKGHIGNVLWANYWHSSYLPDWRPQADYRTGYAADPKTGGVIFDVIHGFDLLYFLLGNYSVSGAVARVSGVLEMSSDDCADILCQHTSGVTSTLHMDFITRPKTHTFTVAGTHGTARVDISRRSLVVTGGDGVINFEKIFDETHVNNDYCEELQDFINAIQGKPLRGCSLSDGMDVLTKVIESRKLAGLPHDQ